MARSKERKREYMREYYHRSEANRRKIKDRINRWRRLSGRPHSVARRQSTVVYRTVIIAYLRQRDGQHCGFCGKLLEERVTIDHITPVALGGLDCMENLRLAHATCNTQGGITTRKHIYGH